MIASTIRKHSWSVLALAVVTILFGMAPQMRAAQSTLTAKQAKALVTTAKTKADHERLAQYFDAEAAKYEAQAKEHGELAGEYQKSPPNQPGKYSGYAYTFEHCDSHAKSLQQAAENARKLAADHREMVKEAK